MGQIIGNDVIGLPGQNLSPRELRVLVGLADGETPTTIAHSVGVDSVGLRHIERDVQTKLGGKTKTHTISRGFVTGVLITRALCLLLAFIMATECSDDFTRIRTRTPTARVRVRSRREGEC